MINFKARFIEIFTILKFLFKVTFFKVDHQSLEYNNNNDN